MAMASTFTLRISICVNNNFFMLMTFAIIHLLMFVTLTVVHFLMLVLIAIIHLLMLMFFLWLPRRRSIITRTAARVHIHIKVHLLVRQILIRPIKIVIIVQCHPAATTQF